MIQLNDGTNVSINDILAHMVRKRTTTLTISQQHVDIFDHTDTDSLDFLLRCHAENMATAQATELVVEQLLTSGYFEPATVRSNVSNRMVKGIRISS